jgi:hypothetical protein
MTNTAKRARKVETVTFADVMKSFDNDAIEAMCEKIRESFVRRDAFESANNVAIVGKSSSYAREKQAMLNASIATAQFFLALGVEPSAVIERKVTETSMFNAKALKKVRELAQYCGGAIALSKVERVMRAFIACALVATDKNVSVITNKVNVNFLNSSDLSARLADSDLVDSLADLRHTAMTSGAQTQSSQARNVLDVLNLGNIESVERARDAITLNASHAFFNHMRGALLK